MMTGTVIFLLFFHWSLKKVHTLSEHIDFQGSLEKRG